MKIYRIRFDVNNFQYLLPENTDISQSGALIMDCTPKASYWTPPKVYSYKSHLKTGDFWGLGMATTSIVTTPKATEILRTFLEMAGELLPLPYLDKEFTILNVTECINCLDDEHTEWVYGSTTGAKIGIQKYAFHIDRFSESTIFKIPATCRSEILTIEGLKDPEDEFKYVVEQENLQGIVFEEVWKY